MPDHLSIAVIVPILNESAGLVERLHALRALAADELVFSDGGSSDDSLTILEREGVLFVAGEPGRATQMNAGTRITKSDIILFLHIDTNISSSHLLAIEAAMADPEVVGGRFDIRLSGAHPAFRVIEFMVNLRSRLTKISTGDQAMFVRRQVFEEMGGFADLPLMEDVEFSRRLKKRGKVVCLRDKVETSSRRWEQHGIFKTIWLMWKLRLLYWLGVSSDELADMYRQAR